MSRAYRQKGARGRYVNLTLEQQVFIINNKSSYTNSQIAKELNVTVWTVEYFKTLLGKKDSDIESVVGKPISKKEVLTEIEALLYHAHRFPSFSNGAYGRIKALFNILINKYI